jgi:hypothetical protein
MTEIEIKKDECQCEICQGLREQFKDSGKPVDFLSSQRFKNILLGVFNMLLLIGVFFLGFDASHWTNDQIKQYCINYNSLPKNVTCRYDYWGNCISNVTLNLTDNWVPPVPVID